MDEERTPLRAVVVVGQPDVGTRAVGGGGGGGSGGSSGRTSGASPGVASPSPRKRSGGGRNKLRKEGAEGQEEEEEEHKPLHAVYLVLFVVASVVFCVGNSISYKQLLSAYRSDCATYAKAGERCEDHDYEYFANQWNVGMYVVLASLIVFYLACLRGERSAQWRQNQQIDMRKFSLMGFFDASGGFLSTIGGAYTAGSVQTLLNQTTIPMTLIMSKWFLGAHYNVPQQLGAYMILAGAVVAVVPSFEKGGAGSGGGVTTTTAVGATVFFSSIIPGAFSNVYKESAFRNARHTDVFLLTTIVSAMQVLIGFAFMPILSLPGFGGTPFSEIPTEMWFGFRCFLGKNSLPGDHCEDATVAMFTYVLINFGYNVFQLVVTKHGSATLMVTSASLALPLTNIAFSMRFIMGDHAEPFSVYDIIALVIVGAGFLIYSVIGPRMEGAGGGLPIQGASGSMIYTRGRSNSDPPIPPSYTPLFRRYKTTPRFYASTAKFNHSLNAPGTSPSSSHIRNVALQPGASDPPSGGSGGGADARTGGTCSGSGSGSGSTPIRVNPIRLAGVREEDDEVGDEDDQPVTVSI